MEIRREHHTDIAAVRQVHLGAFGDHGPTLSPLGVVPEYQRQGVGSALIRHGVDVLAARQVPLVFLESDPAYYSRLGFEPATKCGFRRPSLRIPERAFQVMRLPSYEPWMTGTFVYRDTFWNHDAVGLRDS